MRKRMKVPSPAMTVAMVALVMAMGGSAVAAVDFARNAGAVDGKQAVSSNASLSRAAGKLVATNGAGRQRGQLPSRFVDFTGAGVIRGQGRTATYARAIPVVDNQTTAPQNLLLFPSVGSLTVSCRDENPKVGVTNPRSILSWTNQSGTQMDYARQLDGSAPIVSVLANGTQDPPLTAGLPHMYRYVVHVGKVSVLINGAIAQYGAVDGTTGSACGEFGQALLGT